MTNFSHLRNSIGSLLLPGQLTEMRLLLSDKKWAGFFFDDHDRLAAAASEMDSDPNAVLGVYLVLNPIDRAVLDRPHCNLYLNPTDPEIYRALLNPNRRMWPLTGNDDIQAIEWAMVDVDPVRAPGFEGESASDAERNAAAHVRKEVITFCDKRGCTAPALASSGNGWHALYRVALANAPEDRALIAGFLRTLGLKFSNARNANIDQAVKNAARLTRVYGTTTRKGVCTDARPWRMNRLEEKGSDIPCSRSVLGSIAALSNSSPALSARHRMYPTLHEDFDADHFVEWIAEVWPVADEFDKGDTHFVVLEECLNVEWRHRGDWKKSAFILGETLGYRCFSDDCADFGVAAALSKLTALHGEPYPGEIYADDIEDLDQFEVDFDDTDEE